MRAVPAGMLNSAVIRSPSPPVPPLTWNQQKMNHNRHFEVPEPPAAPASVTVAVPLVVVPVGVEGVVTAGLLGVFVTEAELASTFTADFVSWHS